MLLSLSCSTRGCDGSILKRIGTHQFQTFDEPPNEWIVDDAQPTPAQLEVDDAQSSVVSRKRRLIQKSSSNRAKKARAVAEVEVKEEEFESSNSEHEEEENIPYADHSSDDKSDEVKTQGNDNE